MIDCYTWPTPNGHKVHIMLEETGLPWTVHPINIQEGDQFKPDFLKISPNNKMPAIVDRDGPGGKEISVFETGAILIYLGVLTVLNVALNLVLIPPYGHWGAAVATLLTMLVYGAAQYGYLLWALPGRAAPLRIPLPSLAGGIAMAALLWWLREESLAATVIAAAILYGAALAAAGLRLGGAAGRRFELGKVLRQFDGARG